MTTPRTPMSILPLSQYTYDASTGIISNTLTGKQYNTPCTTGYITVSVPVPSTLTPKKQIVIKAHRLAWWLYYCEEPPEMIDHIDNDRSNNKISNLRKSNNSLNQQNVKRRVNAANMIGVKKNAFGNYMAHITSIKTGMDTSIGTYADAYHAHLVCIYYKSVHFQAYTGLDISNTPNHPYFLGTLPNIVAGIYDTKGKSALVHLSK